MDKRCVTRIPSIFDSDDEEEPPKDGNLYREDTPTEGTSSCSPASATSCAEKAHENSGNEALRKPENEDDASNESFGELCSDSKEEDSHNVKNIADDKSASDYDENDEDEIPNDNNSSEENTDDGEDIEMKECVPDNEEENNDRNNVGNIDDKEDMELKDDILDEEDMELKDDILDEEDMEVKDDILDEEDDEDDLTVRDEDQEGTSEGEDNVDEIDTEGEDNFELDDCLGDEAEREDSLVDEAEQDSIQDEAEQDSIQDEAEQDSIQDDAESDNMAGSKDDVTYDEEMLEEGSLDEDGDFSEDDTKDAENGGDSLNEENDIEDFTKEPKDTEEVVKDSDDIKDDNVCSTSGENVVDKRDCSNNSAAEDSDMEMDEDESSIAESDNEKKEAEDDANDSKDEEGSGGYIIDLNETDSEPEAVKPEKRKDAMESSSFPELGLEIDVQNVAKPVEPEKKLDVLSEKMDVKEKQLSPESPKDSAEDVEKESVEACGSAGNRKVDPEETESPDNAETTEKKDIKEAVVPKRKKKLAPVHIPVKVSDVYTDSEEESEETKASKEGENKDEDIISSTTKSADPDDQKDNSSLSSRQGSVEPDLQALSSTPLSQPSTISEPKQGENKDDDIISSTTASADPDDQKDNSSLSSRQGSVEPDLQTLSSAPLSHLSTSSVGSPRTTSGSENITVFKKKKPRRSAVGVFDRAKCLYALEVGWRREMVYRATVDSNYSKSVRADVYYYTPNGKKLRSKVEIEDFLARKGIKNLTIENFCFAKESIGGTETQEVIRHATKSQGGTPLRKVDVEESQLGDEKTVLKIKPSTLFGQGIKRGRPRGGLKIPSPKRVKLTPVSPKKAKLTPVSPKKVKLTPFSPKKVKLTPVVSSLPKTEHKTTFRNILPKSSVNVPLSSVRSISTVIATTTSKTQPTVSQSSGTQKNQTPYCRKLVPKNHVMYTTKLCESEVLPPRILTPMLNVGSRQQAFHCTGLCPLAVGQVPSLQCMKCLCLFHAKCTRMPIRTLDIIQSGGAKFLCPNCYKEQKEKVTTREFNPPKTYEPLATDPPPSSESDDDDDDDDEAPPDPSVYPPDYVKVNLYNTAIPTPPASPERVKAENADDQTDEGYIERIQVVINPNVYKGPVSRPSTVSSSNSEGQTTMFNPKMVQTGGSKPAVQGSGNNVLGLSGSQIFKIQAAGVNVPRYILVRPSQTSVTLPPSGPVQPARPIYIPSVAGPVPFVFPNTGMASVPQLQTYGASSQTQLMSSGSAQVPQIYNSSGYPFPHQNVVPSTGFPSSAVQSSKPSKPSPRIPHSKIPVVVIKTNFLQELSQSYSLLLKVFRYLTAKDLLVTSRVCLMWRDLSYSPSLWRTVRLRNICIKDWKQLALFLERRNTTAIDLRKMVFRVQQSNFNSEEPSRLDSPGSPSLSSSHSYDQTPSSTTENTPQKEPSSSEKCIDEESESKVHEVADDNDAQSKRSNESPSREDSVKSAVVANTPDASKPSIIKETQVSQDALGESVGDEEKNTEKENIIGDNTRKVDTAKENLDVSGIKKEIEGLDSKPLSENEDEPMEIDEDSPSVCSELPVESNSKEQIEESLNITEQNRNAEIEKGKEKQEDKGLSDDQICTSQKKVIGYTSSHRKASAAEKYSGAQDNVIATWSHICEALGSVRCLRSVVMPSCRPVVLQLLLSNCKNLTSVTAADIGVSSNTKFDPAYLMEAPYLKELRICSTQGFSFTTNFNFIKLPELKVLVIRGLMGNTWPYLGTNLTSLHLGPCQSFTPQTWRNIGSMTRLKALWLEDGGSVNDAHIFDAIGHLTQLRRLCLFNFTVSPKLGVALRKLHKLERLFVLQNSSDGVNMGIKNHNMLAVTELLKNILNLVWAVSSQDIKIINGADHMQIFSPNIKSYPSLSAKENTTDQWPVKLIETVVSRHLASTDVRIMKLDPAAAARMALSTL